MCKVTTSARAPKKAITAAHTQKRRRVSFGSVQAKVFSQRLSRSEKKSVWYSGSDYKAMNKEVHRSLRKELYYGFDPTDSERSWRGLEHIREGVPNVKLQRRRSFVRGLLYYYKTMGVKDPKELSAIATSQSSIDQVRAQQFADYDAYEASCVHYEHQWRQHHFCYMPEDVQEDYKEFCNIPRSKVVTPTRTVLVARAS